MKGMVASLAVALAVIVAVMSQSAAAASTNGAAKAGSVARRRMDGRALASEPRVRARAACDLGELGAAADSAIGRLRELLSDDFDGARRRSATAETAGSATAMMRRRLANWRPSHSHRSMGRPLRRCWVLHPTRMASRGGMRPSDSAWPGDAARGPDAGAAPLGSGGACPFAECMGTGAAGRFAIGRTARGDAARSVRRGALSGGVGAGLEGRRSSRRCRSSGRSRIRSLAYARWRHGRWA